jgi:hypothetical protein
MFLQGAGSPLPDNSPELAPQKSFSGQVRTNSSSQSAKSSPRFNGMSTGEKDYGGWDSLTGRSIASESRRTGKVDMIVSQL